VVFKGREVDITQFFLMRLSRMCIDNRFCKKLGGTGLFLPGQLKWPTTWFGQLADQAQCDLMWWSRTCPMEIHQTFHRFQFFFSQNQVGLCMELQDITIKTQFPLYSMQIPPECQILWSVQWNSGTEARFWVKYQGESKDLEPCLKLPKCQSC